MAISAYELSRPGNELVFPINNAVHVDQIAHFHNRQSWANQMGEPTRQRQPLLLGNQKIVSYG
jgi:hypothetical protein